MIIHRYISTFKRGEYAWLLSALLVPLIVAAVLTYPVIVDFSHRIPGWEGDNVEFVWFLYWFKYALLNGKPLFFDAGAYYSLGFNYGLASYAPIAVFGVMPVTLLFGPVVAYNTAIFASFALTSVFTYLWLNALTHNRNVALLCGIVSAFFPYRIAHLAGHLDLMMTQWFPLGFWAIERYITTRRLKWAITIGVSLALAAMSHWYYLIFGVLAFSIYLLARNRRLRLFLTQATVWRHFLLSGIICAILIAPFVFLQIQAQLQYGVIHRPLSDVIWLSLSPLEFLTLSVRHPVWGNLARQIIPGARAANIVEHIVMPGFVLIVFGLVGIFLSKRRFLVRTLVVISVVALFYAMGPFLKTRGESPIPIPINNETVAWLESSGFYDLVGKWFTPDLAYVIHRDHILYIPLPYALVYRLPILSATRGVGRAGLLVCFALCALAGMGLAELWKRLGRVPVRAKQIGLVLLTILILFEYWQGPYETVRLAPRPVDAWLAVQPQGAVLDLPISRTLAARNMFARTFHNQPTVFGTTASVNTLANEYQARYAVLLQLPDPAAIAKLCTWDVRYIVIDGTFTSSSEVTQSLTLVKSLPGTHLASTFDKSYVYTMDSCALTH